MGVRAGAAGWGRPFRFGLSRSCGRTFIDTISPAEIEDVLAGIRSISETAAVLGESEIGLAEIVLYIVPAPGADGSAAVAGRARTAVAGAAALQAAAAVRNCPRSAAHGDRQGPAQQASRATAARSALTPAVWLAP